MEPPIDPSKCKHPRSVLTRREHKNKSLHYQYQCVVCRQRVGSSVPKAKAAKEGSLELFPAFGEEAGQRVWERRKQFASCHTDFELSQFRPAYEAYLKSPEWLEKRRLVLRRAGDICEGCGIAEPKQVHHFSYVNLGNEFLWELAAVCNECHDRAHPWKLDDPNPPAQMRRERLWIELGRSKLFQEWIAKQSRD